MLHVVRCMLSVVGCMLSVACCMLSVACCLLSVACCLLASQAYYGVGSWDTTGVVYRLLLLIMRAVAALRAFGRLEKSAPEGARRPHSAAGVLSVVAYPCTRATPRHAARPGSAIAPAPAAQPDCVLPRMLAVPTPMSA